MGVRSKCRDERIDESIMQAEQMSVGYIQPTLSCSAHSHWPHSVKTAQWRPS